MAKRKGDRKRLADLRQRAEELLRRRSAGGGSTGAPEQDQRLFHELQVHQVELEMQNEELRQAQEKLEASRSRYFDLYDLAPVGYFTLSEQGLILEANLTAATLLGVPRSSLVKQPITGFFFRDDQDIYYLHRKQLFETGVPQVCEMRVTRQGGELFWARLEATVAQDGEGRRVCRAVMSDITERKRAESQREAALEALRQSMEQLKATQAQVIQAAKLAAVGELAAGVAHEINNPLTSILGFAELLLGGLPADVPFRPDLETIARQAMRARDIVRNLLDFARQGQLERQPSDVNQVVQQTLDLIREHMEKSGVAIEEQYAPHLGSLSLNIGQMKQVFLNLINNAAQAMPHGGKLRVATAQVGDEVVVTVSDTGTGIPPEILDRIFDPFFTTKPTGQGTGLGLSVSLGIVQEHGGRITVENRPASDSGTSGSTFSVWLPSPTNP
jgi:two-component system cell cycle sensor histidine kinase/response regulator CckA